MTALDLIEAPSPNHGPRPEGRAVDMAILHYTGMQTGEAALARLRDPEAQVSAHYLVEEDGRIFALVPEDRRAWHAGASLWAGDPDTNSRSIGIEIVNPGHEWGYRDFPARQIAAVAALLEGITARHAIAPRHILAHSDVAPARKEDPGERFPWAHLAGRGLGLWPAIDPSGANDPVLAPGDRGPQVTAYQQALAAFGYGIEATGIFDEATRLVTVAFQRHFQPTAVGTALEGRADGAARRIAGWLAAQA